MNEQQPLVLMCNGTGDLELTIEEIPTRRKLLSATLPDEERIYQLKPNDNLSRIAAGCQSGKVLCWGIDYNCWPPNLGAPILIDTEGPVLSVDFLNNDTLAISDAAGNWFCCPLNKQNINLQAILDSNDPIVAQYLDKKNGIYGLSESGIIYSGQWPNLTLKQIQVDRPSSMGSLVPLRKIPGANQLIYPSKQGMITVFDMDANTFTNHPIYRSEFYALAATSAGIFAADFAKGTVQHWDTQLNNMVSDFETEFAVIACEPLDLHGEQLLILSQDGSLNLFNANDKSLNGQAQYSTNCCPAIAVLEQCQAKMFLENHARGEAMFIAAVIEQQLATEKESNFEKLHERLNELGYAHISILLRAIECQQLGNEREELKQRYLLEKTLAGIKWDRPEHFSRYGELLLKNWLLPEAKRIQELAGQQGENKVNLADEKLRYRLNMPETSDLLLEQPCEQVYKLIDLLQYSDSKFSCFFSIHRFRQQEYYGVKVNLYELSRKLDGMIYYIADNHPPSVVIQKVKYMLRDDHLSEKSVAVFHLNDAADPVQIFYAVELNSSNYHTSVLPSLLLKIDWDANGSNKEEMVEKMQDYLAEARELNTMEAMIEQASRYVSHAMCRLKNQISNT